MQRLKQFYSALTASVTESDLAFIQKNLSKQEQALFFQMDVVDQRHALDVAGYAYQAATARGLGSKRKVLVKAALLHDIGKVRGELTLLTRLAFVLCPALVAKYRKKAWKSLKEHASRGAHMAETFGVEKEVVDLIREHHNQEASSESLEVLQEADALL